MSGAGESLAKREGAGAWWVRLGSGIRGPWPWAEVEAQRRAGLLSRWHEVSADGRRWMAIDEAMSGLDADDEALMDVGASAEASGSPVDWGSLGGTPERRGAARSARPTGLAWDWRAGVVWSAAGLWLLLCCVPAGWAAGRALRVWSWPSGFGGVGVAAAQAWWAACGLGLVCVVAWRIWRRCECGSAVAARLRVGWVVAGGVGGLLLLVGSEASRGMAVATLVAMAVLVWRRDALCRWRWGWAWVAGLWAVLLGWAWAWGQWRFVGITDAAEPAARSLASSARTHGLLSVIYLGSHAAVVAVFWQRGAWSDRSDTSWEQA